MKRAMVGTVSNMPVFLLMLVAPLLLALPAGAGTPIEWQTSRAAAIALAQAQGKTILLVSGRPTCPNCSYMKGTVCESTSPDVRGLIDQYFVTWFCDIDTSSESDMYTSGLGSYTLPMMCCIDPNNAGTYLDRTTNTQDPTTFHSRLLGISDAQKLWWTGAVDMSGGWKWLYWFGFFAPAGNGWTYHNEHGWMYAAGNTPSGLWFWTQDLGWLWTGSSVYPSLYRSSTGAWLWYQMGSDNPRWFYNFGTSGWESH